MDKVKAVVKAIFAAEADSPAVHGALPTRQMAVVAAAVEAVKAYFGV